MEQLDRIKIERADAFFELKKVGYSRMANDVLQETDIIIIKMYRRLAAMKSLRTKWKKYAEYLYSEGRRCFVCESDPFSKFAMDEIEQNKMMALIFEEETSTDFLNSIENDLTAIMHIAFKRNDSDTLGCEFMGAALNFYEPIINKEFERIHDWEMRQKEEEEFERIEMGKCLMSASLCEDRS